MRAGFPCLWERLDRALASDEWCINSLLAQITHLARISSDHTPLLQIERECVRDPKPFRFEEMWYDYPKAREIVESEWSKEHEEDPAYKVFIK